MKHWLLCILLILGWVGSAQADVPATSFYRVKSGDTLSAVFGKDTAKVCELNKKLGNVKRCDRIYPKQLLQLPGDVVAPVALDQRKQAKLEPVTSVLRSVVRPELSCITLGAAPFNPEHNLTRTLEGIDLLKMLTPEQKELAKRKVALGEKATGQELVGQQIFKEMLYQSKYGKKEVVHVYDKPICTPEQGGQPEIMDTYDLGGGVFLSIPRRCGNPSVFTKPVKIPPPPAPPASAPVPAVPASAPVPTPAPETPVVVDKVASDYDWDAGLFVGGDKDVRFAGGEGAGYPLIRHFDWGRYALGGGGSFSLWHGGAPDGYRYSGETAAFGLAQKFSFANRRDLGVKFPMYGDLWTRGHDATGRYQQKSHASMLCAAVSYTDASREKEGKTALPEWQVWASFCDPFSQQKSHSYDGKALDASTLQDVKYVAGVGGRVFLSKNLGDEGFAAKVQPFAELGVNQTAPNPISGHAYIGLRTVDKVWGCGIGVHYAQTGSLPGATCTYDLGRDVKLRIKAERWNAMLRAIEAAGFDPD